MLLGDAGGVCAVDPNGLGHKDRPEATESVVEGSKGQVSEQKISPPCFTPFTRSPLLATYFAIPEHAAALVA